MTTKEKQRRKDAAKRHRNETPTVIVPPTNESNDLMEAANMKLRPQNENNEIVEAVNDQVAEDERRHGEREDEARGGHHRTAARHGADDAGVQPGVDLLLEPGHQQQVVVRSHRQQDDDRHQHDQPLHLLAEQVLPQQHRDAERGGDRTAGCGDDDQRSHHASGEDEHDHEDQRQRRHPLRVQDREQQRRRPAVRQRHDGDPGAGAMGAVIEYRDLIRAT